MEFFLFFMIFGGDLFWYFPLDLQIETRGGVPANVEPAQEFIPTVTGAASCLISPSEPNSQPVGEQR